MPLSRRFLLTFVTAVLTFMTSMLPADDTEIYLGAASSGVSSVDTNVLFVLDTSGSMSNKDGTGSTRLQRMKDALNTILDTAEGVNVGLMRFHREGGPVLYPVSEIEGDTNEIEGYDGEPIVQAQPGEFSDTAEEYLIDGTVVINEEDLEMTRAIGVAGTGETYESLEIRISSDNDDVEQDGSAMQLVSDDLDLGEKDVGLRFQNVSIPEDATIVSAEIEFVFESTDSNGATSLTVYGEKANNSDAFSNANDDLSDRTKTTESVSWSDLAVPTVDETFTSPDLANIVDEITASANGWSSGNALTFILEGSGDRNVYSHDNDSDKAALLRVNYISSNPPTTVTKAIISGNDDAEEYDYYGDDDDDDDGGSSCSKLMQLNSDDLDLGGKRVGLRFQDLAIPADATIVSALIKFTVDNQYTGATNVTIYGEKTSDANAFSTSCGDISNRISNRKTDSAVPWSVPGSSKGTKLKTEDISAIVQEIVSETSWQSGNDMAFLITGSGDRDFESWEQGNNHGDEPVLIVEYTVDSDATATDQIVGIRFQDVAVPKGATVTSATIEFAAARGDSEETSLTIEGEDQDDASTFSATANDISSRTKTTAEVDWNTIEAWSENSRYQTPDLTSIVQEIVNRTGWCGGNAMAFFLNGSGLRLASGFTGDNSIAPTLRIDYDADSVSDSACNNSSGSTGSSATYKSVRQRMKEIIDGLNPKGGTPIVDTLYEAASYYRGEDVFYGKTRGNSASGSSSSLYGSEFTRLSHAQSYTGGTVVRDAGCTDSNLNSSACKTENISGSPTYITPITESCQKNHIILLSDGSPTVNTSQSLVEAMTGTTCSGSGAGRCGTELADFLLNNDQNTAVDGDNNVTTSTIGFNIQAAGASYLQNIATAGGGTYKDASSADELVAAFDAILVDVLSDPTSFAAPTLSIDAFNRLVNNNEIYLSLFSPDLGQRWGGNIKKFKVCEGGDTDGDGDVDSDDCTRGEIIDENYNAALDSDNQLKDSAQSFWSGSADGSVIEEGGAGGEVLAMNPANRKIFTYTGSTAPIPSSNIDFSISGYSSSAHRVTTNNAVLTKALLGDAAMTDTERTNIINWMRGVDVTDEDEDGDTTDNRWAFHDPLHSGVVQITYGKNSDGDAINKVFTTTNDGALRMINAESGAEEWVFIPQTMLLEQEALMENIDGDHIYGLDNTPTVRVRDDDDNDASNGIHADGIINPAHGDYVHLFLSMRRGGRNMYALDVTPTSTLTSSTTKISPQLLWRIEGGSGDFSRLGQTWSRPLVTQVNVPVSGSLVEKDVLIFGGGYDATTQDYDEDNGVDGFGTSNYGNAIYIVDASDGSRLWWASRDEHEIDTNEPDLNIDLHLADMQYAIPSDLALMDSNNTGTVDRIYLGDTGGQVWRIDLWWTSLDGNGNTVIETPTGARLAALSDGTTDVDKRKFFYPPDVAQVSDNVYSSTRDYDLVTITSGNRAHPLETMVYDRAYAIRDYHPFAAIPSNFTTLTHSELYDATENLIQDGDDTQKTAALTSLKASSGWYIDLNESSAWDGEKGLAQTLVLGGKVFFTSYTPAVSSNDPCDTPSLGTGRLYGVNLLSAAGAFDWDPPADGVTETIINKDDRSFSVGGGIPSAPTPVFQKEGVTVMVGNGDGITTVDPETGVPRKKTFWLQPNSD